MGDKFTIYNCKLYITRGGTGAFITQEIQVNVRFTLRLNEDQIGEGATLQNGFSKADC